MMGYNSTLLLLNDGLDDIGRNLDDWWRGVNGAIHGWRGVTGALHERPNRPHRVDIPAGGHANPSSLLAMHHADTQSLLAVGGNYGTVLGQWHRGNQGHHNLVDQQELLRFLAIKHGFTLVRRE